VGAAWPACPECPPRSSGPALASLAFDDRWSHLRDGTFVLKGRVIEARPVARERRLWAATAELLKA